MTPRSKFCAVKHHWFCDKLRPNSIEFVNSKSQKADSQTKSLQGASFINNQPLVNGWQCPFIKLWSRGSVEMCEHQIKFLGRFNRIFVRNFPWVTAVSKQSQGGQLVTCLLVWWQLQKTCVLLMSMRSTSVDPIIFILIVEILVFGVALWASPKLRTLLSKNNFQE